jgi:long-chain acyl-CoA synthetase
MGMITTAEASADAHAGQAGETVPSTFHRTAQTYGDRTAMRHKHHGRWRDISWSEYLERAARIGLGLRELGMQPGDRVAVIGDNCPEWLWIDMGVQGAGGVTVGVYTTNAIEQCEYVITHSEARFLFVENEEQLDKWLAFRDRTPTLERIVVWDETGLRDFTDPMVFRLGEFMTLGEDAHRADPHRFEQLAHTVAPDDTAVIVYTSGTTGPPKGAMLSHANLVWIGTRLGNFDPEFEITDRDEVMSFLPLCHIFERIFSVFVHIAYGYIVNFVESLDTVSDNLREISPTVAYGVPRLWERYQSTITIRMSDATWFKRTTYGWAMTIGRRRATLALARQPIPLGLRALVWVAEWTVFRPLRERLGFDRTRLALTGAAPIAPDVLEFFHAIGLHLVEGYGQTESAGVITASVQCTPGSVGRPLPDVELQLDDDGEILVQSPGVFQGYFRNPDATEHALAGGWLHTGDIGEVDASGHVRIVDRKKDLIITAGGKNIAPQHLENQLKCSPYISDAVVIGDRRKFLSALIVLDEDNVVKFAQDHKVPYSTYSELADNDHINRLIQDEVTKVNGHVARVENVRKFRILPKRLYQEDGEVTPTMKVKRAYINGAYADLIEEMYRD